VQIMIRTCATFVIGSLALIPVVGYDVVNGQTEPIKPIQVQIAQPASQTVLPANTEIILSMNEDLTTKGGNIEEGTLFYLTVVSDVKVGNYVVVPRGSRGAGEVTWKTGKAVFGKSGKMEVELRWVEVAGERIQIDGKYRQEGEGNTVAAVGAVILAAPLLFVIPRGRELSARTKYDVPIAMPVIAPAVVPEAIAQPEPEQPPPAGE
jgi:hypothetical protein